MINATSFKPSEEKRWLTFYDKKEISVELPKCLAYDRLNDIVQNSGINSDKAIEYYGFSCTFDEMLKKIEDYASSFAASGIKEGDYVTVISVSIPETIFILYALNYIGAVANMIDPRMDSGNIEKFIDKANSKVLVVLENVWSKVESVSKRMDLVIVQSATQSLPKLKGVFQKLTTKLPKIEKRDNIISCLDFEKRGLGFKAKKAEYKPNAPAFVVRTGGTTGLSKGVVLTNDSINAVSANFTQSWLDRGRGKTLLNFLPIAASYGIVCGVHVAFTLGFGTILIPMFDPNDFANLVAKYKPNIIVGVPVFYEKMMNNPRMKNMDLSFINTMAAGGDSLNMALYEKLDAFRIAHNVPYPLAQGYGMSEVSSAVAVGLETIHKDGSVGIPGPYTTIGIFDPDSNEELPYNEVGEVCISGPTLMKEYLGEPEETQNIMKLHSDGKLWVHSGDLGYLDEDGFLFISGRIKRTIVRFDGHKSYPIQIETVVCEREDVLNCCVIPVKDLDHPQGELPLIIAEVNKGKDFDESSLRKEILNYCKDKIEDRSQPVSVVFVDDIPMSANSKNDFKALTKEYGAYKYK